MKSFSMLALVLVTLTHSFAVAEKSDLVGHWLLHGSTADQGPLQIAAENQGADLSAEGPSGKKGAAARLDGRGPHLVVPYRKGLSAGKGEFTLALWVHTENVLDDDLGDLVSQFDSKKRRGFILGLRCNTGVTSCQPNYRQLQFGIDSGTAPTWREEGRPGKSLFGFSLAVHAGELFAGTCEGEEAGRVYRYQGPGKWHDCGAPDKANAVSALAVHRDQLYAGSAKYRLAGSALPEAKNPHKGGRVFRYDGPGRWIDCGQLPDTEAIGGLVVYRDRLYASSLYKPAGFFRYEGDKHWTPLPNPGQRVEALAVHDGWLWATSYDGGKVFRYDGKSWEDMGQLGDNTQTYSFAVHQGRLHVGTWPSGKVYRWQGKQTWTDLGRLGQELEVMGMLVHNGMLYGGTLPLGGVFRLDGPCRWTLLEQLDRTPDVRYRRVWTMAQFQGRLFCTTLPSGLIHSLQTGPCVTHDHPLSAGWRHIAAVRGKDSLRLFVDGKLAATSAPFDAGLDLSVEEPLKIGAGPGDYFNGKLSDVRWHRRALGDEEIRKLAASK